MPLANTFLGRSFGKWPWEIEDQPADRVQYYLNILEVEGEVRAVTDTVEYGEDITWVE